MVDENDSTVLPSAFLPAAERYNLATRLDRWVCDHAFDWVRHNPDRLAELNMVSEVVSKMSEQDHHAAELHKALKVLDIPFIADNEPTVVV
jgi:EAL domain-containing protein (putative c-di-GMP-specific phosphodiesterase class I)